jgi:type II secretory pathway component PulF
MEWFLYSWPTLVLLGLALRMALRLNYGARGPEQDDPIYVLINTSSWVLILLGITPVVILGGLSIFGLIIVLLALATLLEVVVTGRESQRRSMCTLLALAVDRGQRIEPSVLLAGHAMRGIVGRAMRRLLAALESGVPLAGAIARNHRALPQEAIAYIAAGNAMEAEAAALKELARDEQSELVTIWRAGIDRISYLAGVSFFLIAIVTFVMIKIVPEFRMIFEEFDIELPAMTEYAVALSKFSVNYVAVLVIWALLMVVLAGSVVSICYLCDYPILQSLTDRVFRKRRSAHIFRILAVATEHRAPLSTVVERLAHVFPSTPIRRRLRSAASDITFGRDWRESLQATGFISSAEQALLKTAEAAGNLPWVLRTLARRNEKRTVYRLAMAIQVLYPCVILGLAAIVGFFVIALFVPIVSLIQSLT